MIGGSSGQERCSFEAYKWYPFCQFFKVKNLEKIRKSARGLGRGGDLIFCISFWKLFPNEIGRHGRPCIYIKNFDNKKRQRNQKTQGKYKVKKSGWKPCNQRGHPGEKGGESIISALKKWANTGWAFQTSRHAWTPRVAGSRLLGVSIFLKVFRKFYKFS